MEPEPIYNNFEYENINNNINMIPTEDELLNTLFNKNSNADYIHKDVKPSSSGTYNKVRFHKIKDTNSTITYRESSSFIYQYFYSNRETKELHNDLTMSFQILYDYELESNSGKKQEEYENINNFFNNTIQNNIRASKEAIAPHLYFAGFVKKEVDSGVAFHFVIISEAFDMTLYEYYDNKKYKGWKNRQANLISNITDTKKIMLTQDDKFIRDSLFDLLEETVYKLNIVCFDIKPGNCVVNLDDKGEMSDIRLIDWDSNYCIHDENLENNEEEQHNILWTNLIFMSIHFLMYSKYNIFYEIMEIDETTINNIQTYICGEDAKYRTIYRLFIKEYFKGSYNDEGKCKDIVSNLIKHSNEFLSLPKGGKKKLKLIFNHKTNKKTRKNKSKKNKSKKNKSKKNNSKKGGRQSNQYNDYEIVRLNNYNPPQEFSQSYQAIIQMINIMPTIQSPEFTSSFVIIYMILYDHLNNVSVLNGLHTGELNLIMHHIIQLINENSILSDSEKTRFRDFLNQPDENYSNILKLHEDNPELEMNIPFPRATIDLLNTYKPILLAYL